MRYAAFCILLLAISEPLLIHAKKVVLVFPRQIRRSPASPWQSGPAHYKKSFHGSSEYPHHSYQSHSGHYHSRKPYYRSPPFPHGGDDFDQGHESVNHVHIPHGKDVTHAITIGKGYVPYDHIKGSFSFGHERYPESQGHKYIEQDHSPTGYSAAGSEYSYTTSNFDSPHSDSFFSEPTADSYDYRERRNDRKKFYSARSIEKDLNNVKAQLELNSPLEKGKELLQHSTDLYKDVLPQGHEPQGAVVLPSGIPPATIAGNKDGIVLRDTVSLDEYHKKLQELTKSWPALMSGGDTGGVPGVVSSGFQQHQVSATLRFPTAGLPGSSFTGSTGWLSDFAQPKQGYAVKEDIMEPQHDFRSMPIQTSPFQSLPLGVNTGIPTFSQSIHG